MATNLTIGNDAYIADGGEIVNALQGDDQINIIHTDDSSFGDLDFDYFVPAEVYGNQGNDWIRSFEFGDYLYGDSGNDTLYGGGGDDFLDGGSGADTIWTGSSGSVVGGDALSAALDGDLVWAGTGDDTVYLQDADNGDTIRGEDGYDILHLFNSGGFITQFSLIAGGSNGGLLASGFEELHYYGGDVSEVVEGGNGADWINGGGATDLISGLGGNDMLFGGDGADLINGNGGEDTIYGGDDDDNLRGNEDNDVLNGEYGNDTITDGDGDDLSRGNAGSDTFYTGRGHDTVYGGDDNDIIREVGTDVITVIFDGHPVEIVRGDTLHGDNGDDNIQGGSGSDQIYGDSGNDVLDGGTHDDILDGGRGADTMRGGSGNDTYVVDDTADTVNESIAGSSGTDLVRSSITFSLTTNVLGAVENLLLLGTGNINGDGNALANSITGNAGINAIDGKAGADTMSGFGGNDTYYVDNSGDLIVEGAGNGTADRLYASTSYALGAAAQVEEIYASAGTTTIHLLCNDFAQSITGNAGNNGITGRGGSDTLTGLGGFDVFVFDSALGAGNIDTITDFSVADDTIRLENAIFVGLATGQLAAAAFRIGAAAADADDRIIYNSATGALIFDSNGNAAGGAQQFATLDPGLALTNADFAIV